MVSTTSIDHDWTPRCVRCVMSFLSPEQREHRPKDFDIGRKKHPECYGGAGGYIVMAMVGGVRVLQARSSPVCQVELGWTKKSRKISRKQGAARPRMLPSSAVAKGKEARALHASIWNLVSPFDAQEAIEVTMQSAKMAIAKCHNQDSEQTDTKTI